MQKCILVLNHDVASLISGRDQVARKLSIIEVERFTSWSRREEVVFEEFGLVRVEEISSVSPNLSRISHGVPGLGQLDGVLLELNVRV
jgi:hypothetical protein